MVLRSEQTHLMRAREDFEQLINFISKKSKQDRPATTTTSASVRSSSGDDVKAQAALKDFHQDFVGLEGCLKRLLIHCVHHQQQQHPQQTVPTYLNAMDRLMNQLEHHWNALTAHAHQLSSNASMEAAHSSVCLHWTVLLMRLRDLVPHELSLLL